MKIIFSGSPTGHTIFSKLCNYFGEKGLDSVEAVLAGAAMGLLDCPVCPSFKEFRGTRPGRIDFFSVTGLSWNNKGNPQHLYSLYSHHNVAWSVQVCLTLMSVTRLFLSFRPQYWAEALRLSLSWDVSLGDGAGCALRFRWAPQQSDSCMNRQQADSNIKQTVLLFTLSSVPCALC